MNSILRKSCKPQLWLELCTNRLQLLYIDREGFGSLAWLFSMAQLHLEVREQGALRLSHVILQKSAELPCQSIITISISKASYKIERQTLILAQKQCSKPRVALRGRARGRTVRLTDLELAHSIEG